MKFKELKQDIKLQEFRQNNSKLLEFIVIWTVFYVTLNELAEKAVGMPLSQWAKEPNKKFKTIRDK